MYSKTVDLAELILWNGGSAGAIPEWDGSAWVARADVMRTSVSQTMADGLFLATDEIRARDTGGLQLNGLSGTAGILVNQSGRVGVPVGGVAFPGLFWGTDNNSGFYQIADGTLSFASNGVSKWIACASTGSTPSHVLRLDDSMGVGWSTNPDSANDEVRLYRSDVRLLSLVGVGGVATLNVELFDVHLRDAGTAALTTLQTIRHNSSGTPAAGFGSSLALQLESSTTEDRDAAAIDWLWQTATDASRSADLVLSAYDTAKREGIRIRGTGTAAAIGFMGADPVARQAHIADPVGGTTEDTEARAVIGSILDALEAFGLLATA